MTKREALDIVIGMAQAYQQLLDSSEKEMLKQNDALDLAVLIQQEIAA